MAYDRETLEQVAEIFRQRRANAIAQQQARREEVYKKIPRIKEIDVLTKERYRELVSGIFGGKSLTKSEIRSSSVDLRAERADLLIPQVRKDEQPAPAQFRSAHRRKVRDNLRKRKA